MSGKHKLKTKPKKYQWVGAKTIHKWGGRALLADDMGLGKTLQVLLYIYKTNTKPVIIVCPASAKMVWKSEALKHFNMYADVAEGRKPPSVTGGLIAPPKILVINYDILSHWATYIESIKPELIVFDEAHYLADRESKRTITSIKLADIIPKAIPMTGTPMNNRQKDLWPLIRIVKPDLYPSFLKYAWEFCEPKKAPWGKWEFNGARKSKKLHKILKNGIMIRRRKSEVLKELPAKQRQVIPIELSKKAKAEYTKATRDFLGWLGGKNKAKAKKAKKAVAVTKLGYLLRLSAKLKFKAAIQWVDDFLEGTDEKIILFVHHKAAVRALERRYRGRCVSIVGSTKKSLRKVAADRFQTDPKIRVFIGNGAAAEALTLHAASTVAFLELWWVPGKIEQAEDRAHRIGQLKQVMIYYLLAVGTYEEKLAEIVQKKQRNKQEVIDGEFELGDDGYQLSLLDQLLESIEKDQN